MERFLLQRADGAYFRHPTNDDLREWTDFPKEAHQWVDIDAAAAAAFIWNNLKGEDVIVVPTTFTASGYELSVQRR
jgi:hypothetical protein